MDQTRMREIANAAHCLDVRWLGSETPERIEQALVRLERAIEAYRENEEPARERRV